MKTACHLFAIVGALLCSLTVSAQFENTLWFFGKGSCGLKFSLNDYTPHAHTLHSALNSEGACVVTHPATGVLIFYSDGNTVYNSRHRPMPNGQVIGGCNFSVQAAVAVQRPGIPDQYYLFSNMKGSSCDSSLLKVSIINMNLDQGLGDVESTQVLHTNIQEGMTAIAKPMSGDSWLICRNSEQGQSHMVYRIDDLGIYLDSIYSYSNIIGGANLNYHPRSRMVSAYYSGDMHIHLNSFDPNTGILENTGSVIPTEVRAYDIELSKDGRKVYYSDWENVSLYQYDLNSGLSHLLHNANDALVVGGGLKMGPDDRIYHITNADTSRISVIYNPNGAGNSCSFQPYGLDVHTKVRGINFPETLPPRIVEHGIINEYTKVLQVCGNTLLVENAQQFSVGDTVLVIQMQGATINTSNDENFGALVDLGTAGKYEKNIIQEINGDEIGLKFLLRENYDPAHKVQLVSIPYLGGVTLNGVTCLPWNGNIGGVLAFSGNIITLQDHIDVSGKGFRGGQVANSPDRISCNLRDCFFYDVGQIDSAGIKGEGIAALQANHLRGKGSAANGGGAGNEHNGGGGGGANAGPGGRGGYWIGCSLMHTDAGGYGGNSINYDTEPDRLFLGSGGGAGHSNNFRGQSGGNGGGIIYLKANEIIPNGYTIRANGESVGLGFDFIDGAGGGGAGGSILLDIPYVHARPILAETYGGYGGMVQSNHGQGGGGGGGAMFVNLYPAGGILLNHVGGKRGNVDSTMPNQAEDGGWGEIFTQHPPVVANIPYQALTLFSIDITEECDSTSTVVIAAQGNNLSFTLDDEEWQSNPTFTGIGSGLHTIAVTDGCKLVEEDITIVNYPPPTGEIAYLENVMCDSLGKVELIPIQGKPSFSFSLSGRPGVQEEGFIDQLAPGFYTAHLIDARNCLYQQEFNIEDESYELSVILPQDTFIQQFDTIKFSPITRPNVSPLQFAWATHEELSCTDCPMPMLSPNFNTSVSVTVTDKYGCQGTVETNIILIDSKIYIPNAFSPNGDGVNDYFFSQAKEGIFDSITSFQVFDRWGNQVFKVEGIPLNEPQFGWDGTISGNLAAPGLYVYFLELKLRNNRILTWSGDIILMR